MKDIQKSQAPRAEVDPPFREARAKCEVASSCAVEIWRAMSGK